MVIKHSLLLQGSFFMHKHYFLGLKFLTFFFLLSTQHLNAEKLLIEFAILFMAVRVMFFLFFFSLRFVSFIL